jgi:hypothetical protein
MFKELIQFLHDPIAMNTLVVFYNPKYKKPVKSIYCGFNNLIALDEIDIIDLFHICHKLILPKKNEI